MSGTSSNEKYGNTKSKKRGSTDNPGRLEAFASASPSSGADWGACDPKRIQAVILGITQMGGAVTFGLSRDLGSHFLTLLLDENRKTLWFNGDAELSDELDLVIGTLDSMQ